MNTEQILNNLNITGIFIGSFIVVIKIFINYFFATATEQVFWENNKKRMYNLIIKTILILGLSMNAFTLANILKDYFEIIITVTRLLTFILVIHCFIYYKNTKNMYNTYTFLCILLFVFYKYVLLTRFIANEFAKEPSVIPIGSVESFNFFLFAIPIMFIFVFILGFLNKKFNSYQYYLIKGDEKFAILECQNNLLLVEQTDSNNEKKNLLISIDYVNGFEIQSKRKDIELFFKKKH